MDPAAFIADQRSNGFSDEQIISMLVNGGWEQEAAITTVSSSGSALLPQAQPQKQQNHRRSGLISKKMIMLAASSLILLLIVIALSATGQEPAATNAPRESQTDSESNQEAATNGSALEELQQSRLDTSKKATTGRLVAAIENYAANKNGIYPQVVDDSWLIDTNNADLLTDQAGTKHSVVTSSTATESTYSYFPASTCNPEGNRAITSSSRRDFAIIIGLNSGFYCQDNL